MRYSFSHLFALMDEPLSESQIASIGGCYERLSNAAPTGINGYPFFFSCRTLHRDDVQPLIKRLRKKDAALEAGFFERLLYCWR